MKVYADATETSFFKTNNHIKNLHEIEINNIEDFVYKFALDSAILLDIKCWMVSRFDELIVGNPNVSNSEEPELHGEWIEIDFITGLAYLDILQEIAKFENIGHSMEDYKKSNIFQNVQQEYINDGNDEKWTIIAMGDDRKLEVIIDSEDSVMTRIVQNEL
jgi:hypothetical protein